MTTTRDDAQVLFHVAGLADTNLLPRLLEPFCLRDIVPEHVSAERQGDEMRVTIAVRRDACPEWEAVARKLGQIFVVKSVLTSVADDATMLSLLDCLPLRRDAGIEVSGHGRRRQHSG